MPCSQLGVTTGRDGQGYNRPEAGFPSGTADVTSVRLDGRPTFVVVAHFRIKEKEEVGLRYETNNNGGYEALLRVIHATSVMVTRA